MNNLDIKRRASCSENRKIYCALKFDKKYCEFNSLHIFLVGEVLRRGLGLANHHPHLDAPGHLLPVPLDRLSLRDLEEVVQIQKFALGLRLKKEGKKRPPTGNKRKTTRH